MQHSAFHRVTQALRVHHQTAVMRTHEALRPYMTGLAVYFHLGNLSHNGLAAERVCHAAPSQDVSTRTRLGGRTRIPAIGFRGRTEDRNGPRPPEAAVIGGAGR